MQYEILHNLKPNYGKTSIELFDIIKTLIIKNKIRTLLDFGCGKSELSDKIQKNLGIICYKYDPAIKNYSELINNRVDLVICTDVLQHIPEYDLDNIFLQIKKLSNFVFFKIKCVEHHTLLPDGTPANCTVHNYDWWSNVIKKYYNDIEKIDYYDKTSVIFLVKE